MRFNENEEAVSPVIGVILMVAITVILAAVIAVFVFGMADDIQTSHTVAATSKVSGDNVIVTYQGGPDAAIVKSLNASLYDGDTWNSSEPLGTTIGSTATLSKDDDVTRVLVTAEFNDGTTQVLIDKQL